MLPPDSVYFTAFSIRFTITCFNRSRSPEDPQIRHGGILDDQSDLLPFRQRAKVLIHTVEELIRQEPAEAHLHLARFDPRDLDEIIQKRIQSLCVPVCLSEEIPVHRRIIHRAIHQRLEEPLDRKDGCTEFMGDIPEELTAHPFQLPLTFEILSERLGHIVDPRRKRCDLIPTARLGTRLEIPACDRMRRACDLHGSAA